MQIEGLTGQLRSFVLRGMIDFHLHPKPQAKVGVFMGAVKEQGLGFRGFYRVLGVLMGCMRFCVSDFGVGAV